ncbi:MAG: oligoribonuclease [Lentisphaeraceae bacterium]|nr:oligoribonuclease [Lentisphaeraceae bacterium]
MKKFFFIDMEMTGLDIDSNRIIEVAVIITDIQLREIERYQAVIRQPQTFIDAMDEWNVNTHTESGLIHEIQRGRLQQEVEMDLVNLVKKHFGNYRVMLSGNSISQDKLFIEKYMKRFAKHLHYRIIDISSMKAVYQYVLGVRFQKGHTHRAMDDVEKSIEELKLYLSFMDERKLAAYQPPSGDDAGEFFRDIFES